MWWLKGSLLNNPAWKVPMFFCMFFFRGLKVTAKFAPENEWLEYDPTSFWGSFGLFSGGRCLLLVSGSVLDQNDRNTLLPQPRWVLFFVHWFDPWTIRVDVEGFCLSQKGVTPKSQNHSSGILWKDLIPGKVRLIPKFGKKTAWKSCGLRKSCGSWWGLFECWNTTLTTWSPSWWYCYWTLKSASASAKHGIYIDGPGISFLRSERLALYDMCHNGEKFHSSVFFTLQIMWARPFNRKWSKFFCC